MQSSETGIFTSTEVSLTVTDAVLALRKVRLECCLRINHDRWIYTPYFSCSTQSVCVAVRSATDWSDSHQEMQNYNSLHDYILSFELLAWKLYIQTG